MEVKKKIAVKTASARKIWNEGEYIKQIKEKLGDESYKLIDLYEYFKNEADSIRWGTGNVNGSFAPIFKRLSKNMSPFSFYSNGSIYVKFGWLKDSLPDEQVDQYYQDFVGLINKRTDINIPSDFLDKEITISADDFIKNYDAIMDIMKNTIKNF